MLAAIYANRPRYRPDDPHWEGRDRFLLSTGHYAIGLYAALAEAGIVPVEELDTYGSDDSRLPMSGMATYTPGMEISGGSLGHGLPVAVGLALGLRYQRLDCPGVQLPLRRRAERRLHLGGGDGRGPPPARQPALRWSTSTPCRPTAPPPGCCPSSPSTTSGPRSAGHVRGSTATTSTRWSTALDRADADAGADRPAVGRPLRHPDRLRRAAAGEPGEGALHAHRRTRMAPLPRAAEPRRTGRIARDDHHHPDQRPKLKTSAMIACFADPGQKTTPAPFGHALVTAAEQNPDRRPVRGPGQVHRHAHLRPGRFPERFFQVGMAEQLLLGAAAGMAETGLIPFVSTYSVFAARRAYDFLCLDAAEPGPERQRRRRTPRADHRLRTQPPGHRGRRDLPRHART